MEDDWATYGLNVYNANLTFGQYGPGSPWSARSNNVVLPFTVSHEIKGTGEPRDNPINKITVAAYGGFRGGTQFATPAKSAIRGGA